MLNDPIGLPFVLIRNSSVIISTPRASTSSMSIFAVLLLLCLIARLYSKTIVAEDQEPISPSPSSASSAAASSAASSASASSSSSQSEYAALQELDSQISALERRQQSRETLGGLIALAQLQQLRNERWRQGGGWAALRLTDRALSRLQLEVGGRDDEIEAGGRRGTAGGPRESETQLQQEMKEDEAYALTHALRLHKVEVLLSLGEYVPALRLLDEMSDELSLYDAAPRNSQLSKQASKILLLKGDALMRNGNCTSAITTFRRAIAVNPCQHKAYYTLALALTSLPDKDRADDYNLSLIDLVKRSKVAVNRISLKDNQKIVARNITKTVCQYLDDDSDGFEVLQEYSEVKDLDSLSITSVSMPMANRFRVVQSTFYWGLFLLYDALDERTAAWQALQQARYLDRFRLAESTVYRLEESLKAADHIQKFFKPDYWPSQSKNFVGATSRSPIFIVGFFRSGSTLLESLLDNHPSVWGMGEDSVFTFEMHEMEKDMMTIATRNVNSESEIGLSQSLDEIQLKDFNAAIRRHGNSIIRKMKLRYKEYHPNLYDEDYRSTHNISDPIPQIPISRIVDKMLLNYRNIALIHLVFPNALILHTVRDPLDTLFSCMKHRFGDSSAFTLEFRTLILEFVAYLEILHHFRSSLPTLAYSTGKRQALVDVRYEELVANPGKVMQHIFRLAEIDASDEMVLEAVHHHSRNVSRPVYTASFLQVKQPIYSKSVGVWKRYGNFLNATIIPELRPHLQRLRKLRALPFDKKNSKSRMNWDLNINFDYSEMLDNLQK